MSMNYEENGRIVGRDDAKEALFRHEVRATLRRYKIKPGYVIHFGGIPVELETEAVVVTGTNLIANDPGCAEALIPLDHYVG